MSKKGQLHKKPLDYNEIIKWIENFNEKNGKYPCLNDNSIIDETKDGECIRWSTLNAALSIGSRGLTKKISLAKIKEDIFKQRNCNNLPKVNEDIVKELIEDFILKYKRLPSLYKKDKYIKDNVYFKAWSEINTALSKGRRGFTGGSSLAKFKEKYFNARNHKNLEKLTEEKIVIAIEEFLFIYKRLPTNKDIDVPGHPGLIWGSIRTSLAWGKRGLPGGSSLFKIKLKYFKDFIKKVSWHESTCRSIMFEIFNKEFDRFYSKTLKNRNNKRLELDCYNNDLKINIEYDGIQHFEFPNWIHKTEQQFIRQQENDYDKDQWCVNNGILQIRVSYKYDTKEEIKNYIIQELNKNGYNIQQAA